MHTTVCEENTKFCACWHAYSTSFQMLLLDIPCLTLLMQSLGQQTTKLLIATVSPLCYHILNVTLNNTTGTSSEPQCLAPNHFPGQNRSAWLPTLSRPCIVSAVKYYKGRCWCDCYITSPLRYLSETMEYKVHQMISLRSGKCTFISWNQFRILVYSNLQNRAPRNWNRPSNLVNHKIEPRWGVDFAPVEDHWFKWRLIANISWNSIHSLSLNICLLGSRPFNYSLRCLVVHICT